MAKTIPNGQMYHERSIECVNGWLIVQRADTTAGHTEGYALSHLQSWRMLHMAEKTTGAWPVTLNFLPGPEASGRVSVDILFDNLERAQNWLKANVVHGAVRLLD